MGSKSRMKPSQSMKQAQKVWLKNSYMVVDIHKKLFQLLMSDDIIHDK